VRRRIVLVVLATTTLVVVAFAIPLGALIRSVARDRAIAAAERDVASLSPTLSVPGVTPGTVTGAIETTGTGADGRMAVWLDDGTVVGSPEGADDAAVRLAREQGQAFGLPDGGDLELYTPVVTSSNGTAVVRALVPEALLDDGVTTAWLALAGVAVVLIAAAVVIADRLARSVTRDATELSGTARALASGQGDARAVPGPTPELADAALALNLLADRIDELRAAERERVADLSHRLRTPLTALRLDAEASGDEALVADVERLEAAISELIRGARRPLHAGAVAATCDLAEVARERARFWSALAEDDARDWELDTDGVHGPCVVSLSGEEAAAALDALVGNVFAHTPEGTPYALSLRCAGGWTTLDVDDAGPGIDAPDEAMGRGETRAGSTGLGLDIARRAAESAGGTLTLDRSPGGGARVRLALPLVGGNPVSERSRRHTPRH
jgi:signal transduction histidine kinase